jgi:Ca-activated chloride channel homolog
VVLTDGEETCGGSPCNLGEQLSLEAAKLTIHVISLRVKGYTWMGEQSALEAKCLAERNGGLYLPVETQNELMDALEKTLGCPMVTRDFRGEQASVSSLKFAKARTAARCLLARACTTP